MELLTNFPILDDTPFEALDIQADGEKGREHDNGLDPVFLPFVMLRFSGPAQECRDILGHLRCCGRCA